MSTGQALLTIGAFILLTTILQGVYTSLGNIGTDVGSGQDGILAATIASSYGEIANGLAFDNITASSDTAVHNSAALTYPPGPEAGEDSLSEFDDFDDFNGFTDVRTAGNSGRRFKTTFVVSYVDTSNISSIVSYRTYVKRLDMKTWRTVPAPTNDEVLDTLKTSLIMGYFHFN